MASIPGKDRYFSILHRVQTVYGSSKPCLVGTDDYFLMNRTGSEREANHSPANSVEYISTPPHAVAQTISFRKLILLPYVIFKTKTRTQAALLFYNVNVHPCPAGLTSWQEELAPGATTSTTRSSPEDQFQGRDPQTRIIYVQGPGCRITVKQRAIAPSTQIYGHVKYSDRTQKWNYPSVAYLLLAHSQETSFSSDLQGSDSRPLRLYTNFRKTSRASLYPSGCTESVITVFFFPIVRPKFSLVIDLGFTEWIFSSRRILVSIPTFYQFYHSRADVMI